MGFFIPQAELPAELNKKFSLLWADNGDAISQQYAGTSALKGDFTRTGERNLLHAMKDGMKSANRFYLRFKDHNRQLALEVLQGNSINDESATNQTIQKNDDVSFASEELTQSEREQNVRQLVADCQRQLVAETEDCYGSWALINYTEYSNILNEKYLKMFIKIFK